MKRSICIIALLFCVTLNFSCQKGEQLNRTRVKGIVVDANDNPIANAHISIYRINEDPANTAPAQLVYDAYTNSEGEYKFDSFTAERSKDIGYTLSAFGGPNTEYKSMNW